MANGEAAEVLRKVIDAAKAGDFEAAKIVLSRAWPVRKNRSINLALPAIITAADVLAALGSVIDAAAHGEITPDEAATLASVLDMKRRAIETADIERRLETLERAKQ
jgi:hypothetical protein